MPPGLTAAQVIIHANQFAELFINRQPLIVTSGPSMHGGHGVIEFAGNQYIGLIIHIGGHLFFDERNKIIGQLQAGFVFFRVPHQRADGVGGVLVQLADQRGAAVGGLQRFVGFSEIARIKVVRSQIA